MIVQISLISKILFCMFQLVSCQVSIHYTKRWHNAYYSSLNVDKPSTKKPDTGLHPFLFGSVHGLLRGKMIVDPFWQHLGTRHTWRPFSETQEWKGEQKTSQVFWWTTQWCCSNLTNRLLVVLPALRNWQPVFNTWRNDRCILIVVPCYKNRPLEKFIWIYTCLAGSQCHSPQAFSTLGNLILLPKTNPFHLSVNQ